MVFRYMAICHPFLVQRSRKPSTFHQVIHQTTDSNLYHKDSDAFRGVMQSDTSRTCNYWLKKMGGCFTSSRGEQFSMKMKKRTCHYLLPVLIFSILLNIPKFFEFETFVIP